MRIEFYSYVDNYVHPDNRVSFFTDSFLLRCFHVSSTSYLDLITFNYDSFNIFVSCVKIDSADSVLRVFIHDVDDFNKIFDCFESYKESYKIPPK